MRKQLEKAVFLGILLLIIAGWFYWFQWRPAAIRTECLKSSTPTKTELSGSAMSFEQAQKIQAVTNNMYLNCLREHGLKE